MFKISWICPLRSEILLKQLVTSVLVKIDLFQKWRLLHGNEVRIYFLLRQYSFLTTKQISYLLPVFKYDFSQCPKILWHTKVHTLAIYRAQIKGPLRATHARTPKKAADKKFQTQNNLAPMLECFVIDWNRFKQR